MADPLSLAATIISTAAAVDKVQSLLESRTSEWKLRGPVRNLMVEFDTFRSSVDQLVHYFVDDILVTDLSIRCYNSLGWLCLLVEAI